MLVDIGIAGATRDEDPDNIAGWVDPDVQFNGAVARPGDGGRQIGAAMLQDLAVDIGQVFFTNWNGPAAPVCLLTAF